MIDTICTLWDKMFNGFSSVADALSKEFTIVGTTWSLAEWLFGGALVGLITFIVIKFAVDIVL